MCSSAASITSQLFVSLLAVSNTAAATWLGSWGLDTLDQAPMIPLIPSTISDEQDVGTAPSSGEQKFTLRHIYHRGTHKFPDLCRRFNVAPVKVKAAAAADALLLPGEAMMAEEDMPGDGWEEEQSVGPFFTRSSPHKIER